MRIWIINIKFNSLNKGNIINGELLIHSNNLDNFCLNKMYGIKLGALKKLEERSEAFSEVSLSTYRSSQFTAVLKFFYNIVPNKKTLRVRNLTNIFFLDVITSYRGWRHSRGLPVRGQRTWTNAWSSYRSNLVLREYKIVLSKILYGNVSANELNVAYLAEQVNLLWKLQWEQEWREAKKKRLAVLKKDSSIYKIDLYSMSRGVVGGYTKSGEKAKKQKQIVKKNYFSLGFDPGFTKALLKNSYMKAKKSGIRGKVNIITDSGEAKSKKKVLKKKGGPMIKQKDKKDSWN